MGLERFLAEEASSKRLSPLGWRIFDVEFRNRTQGWHKIINFDEEFRNRTQEWHKIHNFDETNRNRIQEECNIFNFDKEFRNGT